jgi:hypothetical protein
VISFILRPLTPTETALCTERIEDSPVRRIRSGHEDEEKKNAVSPGIEPLFASRSADSLVTILIETRQL